MEIYEILSKNRKASFWKKLADTWFSRYIRLRGYEEGLGVKCVTCGKYGEIAKMQAGHYVRRSKLPTRFAEDNVFPQCYGCNVAQKGNYPNYAKFIIEKYGEGKLTELVDRGEERYTASGQRHKWDNLRSLEITQEYQKKVDELLQLKQIEPWWTKETKIEQLIRSIPQNSK